MAIIDVKVPQLSESVADATLVSWHKTVGQLVYRDENLIDLETDKVILGLPAPSDGVIITLMKKNGDTVFSGEIIAQIETSVESSNALLPNKIEDIAPHEIPIASPAARKILQEKGLQLSDVIGTGRGGRISKEDAVSAQPKVIGVDVNAEKYSAHGECLEREEDRVPMSRLRARIAERLIQSKNENAILTTFNEVNMDPIITLRRQYSEKFEKQHGIRLGFMSFFVQAACAALQKFPILNASVDQNDIIYHRYIDMGIAISSARGLVVPIIRNADQLTLAEIEIKISEFVVKARDNKLSIEDLSGGTFSISNGGVFGSMLSTPIINPPQSAILGIHATKDRAVVENGQILIRPISYLAISYDHRIIDGREAVLGLMTIKEALEDPIRLLLCI